MTNYESSDENCMPHVYSAGASFVDADYVSAGGLFTAGELEVHIMEALDD